MPAVGDHRKCEGSQRVQCERVKLMLQRSAGCIITQNVGAPCCAEVSIVVISSQHCAIMTCIRIMCQIVRNAMT